MRITAQNILKLTAILTIACLSSCKQLHTKKELTELYGLKIEIPKDMPVTIDGKDSIIQEQAGAYATMVIWYDSLQCVSCYMGFIDAWKKNQGTGT